MKLESVPQIMDFDPFETRTEAEATHNLGEGVFLADQRVFRFAKVGASNISKGKLQLAPAPIANHKNMAVGAAVAAGGTSLSVTPGGTAGAANIYAEGYLAINDVDGEGQVYKVRSHAAITASTAFTVNLFDPIKTALTTSSEATLAHNSYNAVIESAVEEQLAAGVPLVSLLTGDYGWLQTKGIAAVLAGATIALGSWVVQHASTAGAVDAISGTWSTALAYRVVGYALVAGVDTEYRPIFLTID